MKSRFFLVFLVFLTAIGFADNFRIGYEPWVPYGDGSDPKKPKGITVDFYRQVFESLGHTVEFIPMPAARCTEEVIDNRLDGALYSPAVEGKIVLVDVSVEYWLFAAIVNKANPLTSFTSVDEFLGKKVGTILGYEYPESLDGFKGMKQDVNTDPISNLKKVAAGRIDVMFDDPVWAEIESKLNGIEVKTLYPLVAAEPTYLGVAFKHTNLIKQINTQAKKLIDSGLLDSLYKKYLGYGYAAFKKKYDLK